MLGCAMSKGAAKLYVVPGSHPCAVVEVALRMKSIPFERVDLLQIDDVGAEKTSPWVLEQLYAIVNARYEDERSVIITTNLEREDLAEQINERTVSRLEEMCEVLPLFGTDARRPSYDV